MEGIDLSEIESESGVRTEEGGESFELAALMALAIRVRKKLRLEMVRSLGIVDYLSLGRGVGLNLGCSSVASGTWHCVQLARQGWVVWSPFWASGPWQLEQSCRIQVLWGMVGGAPGQAREPGPGERRGWKELSVRRLAFGEKLELDSTWHCVQLAYRGCDILGAVTAPTDFPLVWQATHEAVEVWSIGCGMRGGAPS